MLASRMFEANDNKVIKSNKDSKATKIIKN